MSGFNTIANLLGATSLTEFFTKEIFNIGGFAVLLWHLCVVAVVLLIIVIVAIRVSESRREKRAKQEQLQSAMERSTEQENVNTDQDFAEENAPQQTQAEEPSAEQTEQEEPLAEQSEEKTEAEQEEAQPAESQSTVNETKENEQPEEMPFEEAEETATQPEETEVQPAVAPEQKPAPRKNYHVSLREDGKWQVKLSRGERAIKLFETQTEAIKFAKDKAKAQKGYITIHMVDGKIRRQKY